VGLPVVDGEVIWGARRLLPPLPEHAAGPRLARRCRLRALQEEAEGPWHEEGYAYYHAGPPGGPARRRMSVLAIGRLLFRCREQRVTENNLALDVRG
jgi:hypothetical protein